MGIDSDGILAYGYDLGELYDLDTPEEYEGDKTQYIEDLLLKELAGFTDKWSKGDETFFDRKREAEKQIGVEIILHCSYDYPMYILAAKGSETRAWRGSPKVIKSLVAYQEWDDNLNKAKAVLGIDNLDEPAWILSSIMG